MTDTTTPVTETENNEDVNTPSDARVILGPLVKYAAVGLVIVGIIITTAVMLDSQFNNIDREVAALEAELAQANTETETVSDTTEALQAQAASGIEIDTAQVVVTDTEKQDSSSTDVAQADRTASPAASIVAETAATASPVTQAANQPVPVNKNLADTNIAKNVAAEDTIDNSAVADNTTAGNAAAHRVNKNADFFDKSFEDLIAERNEYLKEMDRVYLEEFKASQEKQLQSMRERLTRQEKRIEEMEQRNQEIYDVRASSVKEMQRMRENFMTDRI